MHTLYMQVAYEEGIYKKNGLAVDGIMQLNSGPLVTQALTANQLDVADTDAEGAQSPSPVSRCWRRRREH